MGASTTAPKESPRLRGKKRGFSINSKEVWPDMSSAELAAADSSDGDTFGSIQAGGTTMKLSLSAIQSTAKTSLWRFLFEHVGETVPFVFAPHGNTTPTADEPIITGKCTIEKPPALTSKVNETSRFDIELPVTEWKLNENGALPA